MSVNVPYTTADFVEPSQTIQQKSPIEFCSCMTYLRYLGVHLPSAGANASDMAHSANTIPHIGAVVLFYYPSSNLYHVALITAFTSEGDLVIKEANYHHCQIDTRTIAPDDHTIIGYWSDGVI